MRYAHSKEPSWRLFRGLGLQFNRILLLWLYILSIFFYAKRLQNRCKFVSVCAAGLSENLCTRRCRPLSSVLSLTARSALRCSPATQAWSAFVVSASSGAPLFVRLAGLVGERTCIAANVAPRTARWRSQLPYRRRIPRFIPFSSHRTPRQRLALPSQRP